MYIPKLSDIEQVKKTLEDVVVHTPLQRSDLYSNRFKADVYFKREDLQTIRSYKIRGAYNKMSSLNETQKRNGIVCASAGNHAQGVAFSCRLLGIYGYIYMPVTTPRQKLDQVEMFGEGFVKIVLKGDTFDEAFKYAIDYCQESGKTFIHPFDDEKIIEGQATIALEILSQINKPIDYLVFPIGGGGLAAGLVSVFKQYDDFSKKTRLIGVEPQGAPSMATSIKNGANTPLEQIDKFVDGAAVKRVGDRNFEICRAYIDQMVIVHEGLVCQSMLDLYSRKAIVVEPAGVLSIAALNLLGPEIEGKTVVCVVSGGNNDIGRMAEISERALLYANLKHYFVVKFPQRSGALKEFVNEVLGKNDDIVFFEYQKKHNKENGPAIVGIELKSPEDLAPLVDKMKQRGFWEEYLNDKPSFLSLLTK